MLKKLVLILTLIVMVAAAIPAFADDTSGSSCDSTIDYLTQGWAQKDAHDLPAALVSFNCGVQLDPQNPHMYYARGTIYCMMNHVDLAIANYQRAIDLDENYAMAWNNLGWANYRIENYQESIKALNQAISLDPELAYAYNNRGLVYQKLGDLDQAAEDFQKAIDLGFEQSWAETNLFNLQAYEDAQMTVAVVPET